MRFLGSSRTQIHKKCLNQLKNFCNKHCYHFNLLYSTISVGYNDLQVLEKMKHLERSHFVEKLEKNVRT